jgi:hypothetical protein
MPVIPAFGRLKQENFQFKASKTLSQKKKRKKKNQLLGPSGSHLLSYRLGRKSTGGSQFKASPRKLFEKCYLKNPSQKRAGGVAQGVVSEFKPQSHKKTPPK